MMKKFKNSKGFTLMEMLIVVAIIAILIAIAIPTFSGALNKAKVGTDTANIRSGYASVMIEALTDDDVTAGTYYLQADGTVAAAATNAYTTQGKSDTAVTIGGSVEISSWAAGKKVKYTVADDKVTDIEFE